MPMEGLDLVRWTNFAQVYIIRKELGECLALNLPRMSSGLFTVVPLAPLQTPTRCSCAGRSAKDNRGDPRPALPGNTRVCLIRKTRNGVLRLLLSLSIYFIDSQTGWTLVFSCQITSEGFSYLLIR